MKNYIYHYTLFGQVNDKEAYGGGAYQSAEYGDTTLTQNEAELAATGVDVVLPLVLGATMVIGSVVALVKMRKNKQTQ